MDRTEKPKDENQPAYDPDTDPWCRREGPPDRRELNTYLAKDPRSGIADRRKRPPSALVHHLRKKAKAEKP